MKKTTMMGKKGSSSASVRSKKLKKMKGGESCGGTGGIGEGFRTCSTFERAGQSHVIDTPPTHHTSSQIFHLLLRIPIAHFDAQLAVQFKRA
jgi:hypothetical protein